MFYINEGKDPFDLTRDDIEWALDNKINLGDRIYRKERSKMFFNLPDIPNQQNYK